MTAGESSHTDIAICYMENRVDQKLLSTIKKRIRDLEVDALTMNQESLAECLFPYKWFNPFPKFKFSERPDSSAASLLEGNIVILVDTSPSAMILPGGGRLLFSSHYRNVPQAYPDDHFRVISFSYAYLADVYAEYGADSRLAGLYPSVRSLQRAFNLAASDPGICH